MSARHEHAQRIRLLLAQGPTGARVLLERLGVSQPTLSRALAGMGDEVIRLGAARSIQYALRDGRHGLGAMAVYRVSAQGLLKPLGELVPVRPEGFVMQQADGVRHHSPGLPWWLMDMRPQGFLGRAYAARHAQALGLPAGLGEWQDHHVLHALGQHGHDAVGNLLLGERSRERFLASAPPQPLLWEAQGPAYVACAEQACRGELPGSSAGGEQPKFSACVQTPLGPRHVLVKFSLPDANPLTERWRDLLLAEHLALETLREAGVAATRSWVLDHAGQRFLALERFDRVGATGRRGLFSLAALEAEFVGDASAAWPELTRRLARDGHITAEAAEAAALLHAFGTLIGNTDMHHGNLSFTSEHGRPYALAPAYDMLPMGFAPRASGALPAQLPPVTLQARVDNATWRQALDLADQFLARIGAEQRCSARFACCVDGLAQHLAGAGTQAARLG